MVRMLMPPLAGGAAVFARRSLGDVNFIPVLLTDQSVINKEKFWRRQYGHILMRHYD
jgi:hypothetical protein